MRKIEQQSKNNLKTWITKDNSSIPITISPREPKLLTMLVDSIPIEVSLGPISLAVTIYEDWLEAIKSLKFVEVVFDCIRGLNFAKSSKDETPRMFSLKYLKLSQAGKISNYARVRRTSVVVMNIGE